MSDKRGDKKQKAKWCEHSERYEDMVEIMTELIKEADEPLDEEERNLLSVAYKNVVGARRASWRVVSAREADEKNEKYKAVCQQMKNKVETELKNLCDQVLGLIDNYLLKKQLDVQAKIFFLKMKGDYFRYMVEIAGESPNRTSLVNSSKSAYDDAMSLANDKLPSTSPIRLGLALNYSVFFYEIMADSQGACKLAKEAFDTAIQDLDQVPEETYKDATLIMQLLRDNLTLWKSEQDEDVEDVGAD